MVKPRAHPASTAGQSNIVVARGKRTGVNILSQEVPTAGGMEDVNEFFDSARSPVTEKENKTNRKKSIRFSLDNNNDDTSISTVKPSSNARKLIGKKTRGSMSPSELSRVSTAPPSTDRSLATHPEDLEEVRGAEEEEEEQTFAHRQLLDSPEAFPTEVDDPVDDPVDDRTPVEDEEEEEEEDDDDLAPPPPPDSPRTQDDDDDDDPVEAPTQNEVDFPTQDFDDDDDKEGDGFNMANDPETPPSQEPIIQEKKKKAKKKQTKNSKKKKETTVPESDDELDTTTKSVPRKTKKKTKKRSRFQTVWSPKGIPAGPREFDQIPLSELKEMPEEGEKNLRRSKRARMKPLEYWKGECIEWGANDFPSDNEYSGVINMPVPKRVCKALPTPYKERKVTRVAVVSDSKKKNGGKAAAEARPEVAPFDSKKLRKKYEYIDGEDAHMWDEGLEAAVDAKVVSYRANMNERDLPLSKSRPKSEGKVVGKAAQAFNIASENDAYVGYIMGNLSLPPKGIKDPESVGSCAQTFTVVSCQPGAVEVSFSQPEEANGVLDPETAQRFLLGPGDLFRIPPGNCYRLQNHSKETECFMTWTIIRPVQSPEVDSPQ